MRARSDHILRVGNGVDLERFKPENQAVARERLGIPETAKVMVSVGALCERKGFHRVIEVLPRLIQAHDDVHFLVVGGGGPEGDWTQRLKDQAKQLGVTNKVHFLSRRKPDELSDILSAADVFVLSTRNEGWANVFLEAMACDLPVVTTNVGGNAEVVNDSAFGAIVPFDDAKALADAWKDALGKRWDSGGIPRYER